MFYRKHNLKNTKEIMNLEIVSGYIAECIKTACPEDIISIKE
jgi:hypothetical protein